MSNLNGLNIDPNVDENSGGFTVIPAGKYKAVIVGDELVDNKSNTGTLLNLKVQIIEGQYAQEIVVDRLNITNPSQVAQKIGQGTLKRICNLCKVKFPPQETSGLMGKPMVITVRVEEFESNTSDRLLKSNKITRYDPADTAIPTSVHTQAQAEPQPQMQQASNW